MLHYCHCCLPCIVPDLSVINFRKKCFLDLPVDHAPLLPIYPCVSRQASAVSITGHGTVLHSRCSVGICCDDIPSHKVHAYLCSAMVPLSLCLQGTYIGYYCVVCKCTCVWANHLSYMISGWSSVSVVSVVSIKGTVARKWKQFKGVSNHRVHCVCALHTNNTIGDLYTQLLAGCLL